MSEQVSKGSKPQLNSETLPILAIDYGEKRVGLAISDRKGILSSPLESVKRTRKRGDRGLAEDIVSIADENGARALLIGKPQVFVETHQKIVDKIDAFEDELKLRTDMQIWYYDESFTSQNAQQFIRDNQRSVKPKSGNIDKLSAALFLQDFLNATKKD